MKKIKTTVEFKRLSELFFSGQYADLISDSRKFKDPNSFCWVIGAHIFLGQLKEAEDIFNLQKQKQAQDQTVNENESANESANLFLSSLIIARFFIGLGLARISKYQKARYYFGLNLLEFKKSQLNHEDQFYVFQGLGFYRHLACRFLRSQYWSDRAYIIGFRLRNHWMQVLSLDLKGQSLIEIGQVTSGLDSLKKALKIAQNQNLFVFQQALEISILNTHLSYGQGGSQLIKKATDFVDQMKTTDNYSRATLLIGIGTQWILKGNLKVAQEVLERAKSFVFANSHRRLKALLSFKMAYIESLRFDYSRSLQHLDNALGDLDSKMDLVLKTKIFGLKLKILSLKSKQASKQFLEQSLDQHSDQHSDEHLDQRIFLEKEIANLTLKTGHAISARIWKRQHQKFQLHYEMDDPLGDLKDLLVFDSLKQIRNIKYILNTGYFLLLQELLPNRIQSEHLLLDLIPNKIAVFSEGEVWLSDQRLSAQLKSLLLVLKKGSFTKGELIDWLWGYVYDPFRHDPMIHSLVHRLRVLLGPFAHWVQFSNERYSFSANVSISALEHKLTVNLELPKKDFNLKDEKNVENFRQLEVIEILREKKYLGISEYAQYFKISKPTATRDLVFLEKKGLLSKIGKARATQYFLTKNLNLTQENKN